MHKYPIYKSVPEDINVLDALPVGAVRKVVFYEGDRKRRDLLSQKGLLFVLSDVCLINPISKHLMAYIHRDFNNLGDYIIREPVFDKKKHSQNLPPASVFLVYPHSEGRTHHMFEVESISKGALFEHQVKFGGVEFFIHSPLHRKEWENRNEVYNNGLDDLLRKYGDLLSVKIEKKKEKPLWWPFPDIEYKPC